MKKIFLAICAVTAISGCSNAGPFVTNVSSDGNNGLNIEKCAVHYNSFTGNVSTGQCSTTYIKLRSN
ncbi:MAG: membrane lipoprotein lipid attachment site-containing protein [Cellvibrionales bacterium]|nr:membrane lipoprotein lipid attachment site-containing protein [Cellvibrionales bacterium]